MDGVDCELSSDVVELLVSVLLVLELLDDVLFSFGRSLSFMIVVLDDVSDFDEVSDLEAAEELDVLSDLDSVLLVVSEVFVTVDEVFSFSEDVSLSSLRISTS